MQLYEKLKQDIGLQIDTLSAGLEFARAKSWALLEQIQQAIYEGMTEREARALALRIAEEAGVRKHWHQPYIRLGKGTALTFHKPLQETHALARGEPYFIDIGPVWEWSVNGRSIEVEGDVGRSFVFGENRAASALIRFADSLFELGKAKWAQGNWTGKALYEFLRTQALESNYELLSEIDGHLLSDFPHQRITKDRMAHNEDSGIGVPWVLELQIVDPKIGYGAFVEDLVLLDQLKPKLP